MTLLAPLFLAGLAAIALPLWLHRRRVLQTEREPFSSAMLLEAQPQQRRARRRWRHRTLMTLRLLLLAALAVAFAQPLWPRHLAAQGGRAALQVIVLDTSMSMGAQGRFERARLEARRLIDGLGVGQRAQLVSAADVLSVVSSAGSEPTADTAALRAALAGMRVGPARLDDGEVMRGLEALLARWRGAVDVHFISDFQASGTPTRFADLLPSISPRRTLAVYLHEVQGTAPPANWAITAVRRAGSDIDVTVQGFATPARALDVALQINGRPAGRLSQPVPAGGQAQFRFRQPLLRVGDNRIAARLLEGDALPADNVRWAVIRNAPAEPVPLLTQRPEGRAARYLSTALAAAGAAYTADVRTLAGFDARALPRYRWVIVDDLGALDATLAQQLRGFVMSGGALFAALGPRSAAVDRLPVLGDALQGSVEVGADAGADTAGGGAGADAPLAVGQIDANHPLLVGLRGWESLQITHLLRLAPRPGDRVLVSTGGAVPLLLQRRLGRGRVLLYTSDLDDDWNDLPVQPLFVGLMAQVARYLSGRGQLPGAQLVGTALALGRDGEPAGQLIDPAGRTVLSLADTRRALTVKLDQTGFYQLYTPAGEALVAVNPDPLESDLAAMPAAVLARWRGALAAQRTTPPGAAGNGTAGAASAGVAAAAAGTRTALAPLLLALLTLLVLAESLLGNDSLRHRIEPEVG